MSNRTMREPIDLDRLRRHCGGTRIIGSALRALGETASTNDVCHDASGSEPEGFVVFAEQQWAGRGQQGRVWTAPPRSALLFSILLEPPAELATPAFLTAWSAAAIARHLAHQFNVDCRIKWPNDLMIAGKKVCGILVERRRATVVGIGLNVSVTADEFPASLRMPATSLAMETGRDIDRTLLAGALLANLDSFYRDALERGPEPVWDEWSRRAEPLPGHTVHAETRRTELTGRLLDLRPDRGARIAVPGRVVTIAGEDLLRVRPVND